VSGHPLVPLGEVLELDLDQVPVRPDETYRPVGVYSFGLGLFAKPPLPGTGTKHASLYRLHESQFVYSRLFGWKGALAIVPTHFDGHHVSSEFPTFNVDQDRALPSYLGWLSRWAPVWDLLDSRAKGLGLNRKRVHVDQLLAVEVPLPSLGEQRRIVERMDRVALVDERSARAAATSGALVQSVLNASLA
jgi:type I restriction enzyme, S subunit